MSRPGAGILSLQASAYGVGLGIGLRPVKVTRSTFDASARSNRSALHGPAPRPAM